VSTFRGLRTPPPSDADHLKAIRPAKTLIRYRCVYCRRILADRFSITAHEIQCDARAIVRRQWLMAVAKFRRQLGQSE
jgi:hypothetical protein